MPIRWDKLDVGRTIDHTVYKRVKDEILSVNPLLPDVLDWTKCINMSIYERDLGAGGSNNSSSTHNPDYVAPDRFLLLPKDFLRKSEHPKVLKALEASRCSDLPPSNNGRPLY